MTAPSTAAANKKLMQVLYTAMASGDSQPFADAMAEDFTWIIAGQNLWSGAWRGKDACRRELFAPLYRQFEDRYKNVAKRFIADGDLVVVECKGDAATKSGQRYDNDYCIIFRIENGKLKEAVEYMDTALAERVLGPPPARMSA